MEDILQKEDGLNTILKLSLEALMRSEREIFKSNVGDYSNGFRGRKVFGDSASKEAFYTLLLPGGMSMNRKAHGRKLPKLPLIGLGN